VAFQGNNLFSIYVPFRFVVVRGFTVRAIWSSWFEETKAKSQNTTANTDITNITAHWGLAFCTGGPRNSR